MWNRYAPAPCSGDLHRRVGIHRTLSLENFLRVEGALQRWRNMGIRRRQWMIEVLGRRRGSTTRRTVCLDADWQRRGGGRDVVAGHVVDVEAYFIDE